MAPRPIALMTVCMALLICAAGGSAEGALDGDLNGDDFVGIMDMDIVLANWGRTSPPADLRADADGDGFVGQADMDILLMDWGLGTLPPLPYGPDPTVLSMEVELVDNSSALTGYVTQDIIIHTGTDWLSAELIVTLDATGDVYQEPNVGSISPQSPNPVFFSGIPELEFDTYVSNGVLGEQVMQIGAVDLGGPTLPVFDTDEISIAWWTTYADDLDELALARVTLADDAAGTWMFMATAYPAEGPLVLTGGKVIDGTLYFAGDLNVDGFVGQTDLDIVLDQWGKSDAEITDSRADPTGDSFVGQFDLDTVLNDWGQGTLPAAPVPEPAVMTLLALGGLVPVCRGRRRA